MTLVVTSCPLLDSPAGVYFGIVGAKRLLVSFQRYLGAHETASVPSFRDKVTSPSFSVHNAWRKN